MTLDEYRATGDANAFGRLSSGEHQNLLDYATDAIDELWAALALITVSFEDRGYCGHPSVQQARRCVDKYDALANGDREAVG